MSAPHTDNEPGWARGLVVHLPLLHQVIPGTPRPQGSMTHFRAGGVTYSRPTREQRGHVAGFLFDHWAGQPPITEPVAVILRFGFSRPDSHYLPVNRRRAQPELRDTAPRFHNRTPDTDRLARLVFDALTGAGVWADDKLAVHLDARKQWLPLGAADQTEVTILKGDPMEITEGAHALTLTCPGCSRSVQFPIELTSRLTVDSLNGGKLKPVMSTKSLEHTCNGAGQGELEFADEDPE